MKVESCFEPLITLESAATNLDHLDLAVVALCMTIVGLNDSCIKNAPLVFVDQPRDFLYRLQPAVYRRAISMLPPFLCPSPTDVMPQGHGIFFNGPGMCGFQSAHAQYLERTRLFTAHILWTALPSVLNALEHAFAHLLRFLALMMAYFAKVLSGRLIQ
ncbi:MAG: hypothetical protein PVI97_16125 [Candidatus Thiodiazotropha sp.]|jgi:hypothetical protein